jgi:NADPH-dependent 2,4-dienoyl-CoA reductase/sulfur reductase-like enzyme
VRLFVPRLRIRAASSSERRPGSDAREPSGGAVPAPASGGRRRSLPATLYRVPGIQPHALKRNVVVAGGYLLGLLAAAGLLGFSLGLF